MRTLLIACLFVSPTVALASSWPQWRGPERNGVAADSPPLTRLMSDEGLSPLWISAPLPGGNDGGWGSPVVADGRVYLYLHTRTKKADLGKPKYPWLPPDKRGHLTPQQYEEYEVHRRNEDEQRGKAFDYRETLHCLDAGTGKALWAKSLPSVYTRFQQSGTAAVADGRVYVHGAARVMRCLDAKTGEVLWETKVPGEFRDEFMMSSFAVADGVAAILDGHLVGLDAKTGAILWQGDKKQTSGTHSSPTVWKPAGGSRSYFIANVAGNATACFEPATGRELWRVRSDASQSTPVIAGDLMITLGSSRRGGLRCYRLSLEGAEEKWVYTDLADPGASPVIVGRHVYAQGEKKLACVDLDTGEQKWATDLDLRDPRYTSLVAADGKVLYACEGLLWFAADPSGFKVLLDGKMDDAGLVASEQTHRKLLRIDQVSDDPKEQEKAEKLYRSKVGRNGPLQCSSPALAGGRLYVRLKQGVACYELTGR